MEAFSTRCHPFHQLLLFTSSPAREHHRIPNLRHHGGVSHRSAMKSPNLQRITTVLHRSHRNPIQFSLKTTIHLDLSSDPNLYSTMNDSNANKEIKSGDGLNVIKDTNKTEKSPEKSPELPPPPEKPLPGDCCGSGCVRCVWDIYYDELEEYNKLCKGESNSTIGSKIS